ncbi:MAG: LacI family DNA-binding transcriptional regulator [Angelakisella sp.]
MIGLKDVAQACGLSVTQVSRALNGKSDVSLATRERVERVAAQIGYVKNLTAQSLSSKQSNQLAVIIRGLDGKRESTSFVIDAIRGINAFARQNGYETVVHFIEEIPESYESYCRQRGVGGMMLFNVNFNDESFIRLQESSFPCVGIDMAMSGENKGCVIVNNAYYTTLAMQQLIKRGRKKIALIAGDPGAFVTIERQSGYEMALRQAGMEPDPKLMGCGEFRLEDARSETLRLMKESPDIDGFFCMSDLMAIGTIDALNSLGYKLPEQVSIFGFDGLPLTDYIHPVLSTIKQDHIKKGYHAARLLTQIMRGEQDERTVVLPCELWLRESL